MRLQEKLNFLLEKYNVGKKAEIIGRDYVDIEGEKVFLLPWRQERRFTELKNMVFDGTLEGISVIRVCRIEERSTDLKSMIYRELDLLEWLVDDEISEIMTFKNGNTANIIAKLECGIVCTVEVSATLSEGCPPLDKHEIIARRGTACDRVVDTQVPQNSIYVYGEEKTPEAYTDVDFELFGLLPEEVALVRQAFEAVRDEGLARELNTAAARLKELVLLSDKSAENTANIRVGGSI